MKMIALIILATIICSSCTKTEKDRSKSNVQNTLFYLNSEDTIALHADQYGMKQYVMAFIKTGDNDSLSRDEIIQLQSDHLKNITILAEQKKLLLAGPFIQSDSLRGIFIFDMNDKEEALRLCNTDPAINKGLFKIELHDWYASSALFYLNDIHKKIQKKNITE